MHLLQTWMCHHCESLAPAILLLSETTMMQEQEREQEREQEQQVPVQVQVQVQVPVPVPVQAPKVQLLLPRRCTCVPARGIRISRGNHCSLPHVGRATASALS